MAGPLTAAILISLAGMTQPVVAQSANSDNSEMAAMFEADQRQRMTDTDDHEAAAAADAQRRVRTRELLDGGFLATGSDFLHAAFIFQHGHEGRDYLLAHILAMRALALGAADGEWIAATTLDRYLQSIGQSQVYGTQFRFPDEGGVTMEPYDRKLLVDHLRKAAGAGDLEAQERKRAEYAQQMEAASAE